MTKDGVVLHFGASCQIGTFLCVFAMFAMDWITALITMLLTGCLYLYIFYRKPGLLLTFCKFLLM